MPLSIQMTSFMRRVVSITNGTSNVHSVRGQLDNKKTVPIFLEQIAY